MKPHDQFAKNYLEQLLSPLGIVEISKEVSDETRQIDLFWLFSTLCDNFCLWNREMLIG